ncbi:MAG: hypothetical protein ABEI96_05610 [Haloarculaceae archaeon]
MTDRWPPLVGTALVIALAATPALAHVPAFPADNTAPDRALGVPDAAKSWAFYDRLERGQVRYYRLRLDAGQRLRIGIYTPSPGPLTPSVVLLSRALDDREPVPPGVTVPPGMGTDVVEGERPASASYEPFAPSANYHTVDVDRSVDDGGTYLLAVYDPRNASGPVGVAVGYEEEFTPTEYLRVPFDLVRVHVWEGHTPSSWPCRTS